MRCSDEENVEEIDDDGPDAWGVRSEEFAQWNYVSRDAKQAINITFYIRIIKKRNLRSMHCVCDTLCMLVCLCVCEMEHKCNECELNIMRSQLCICVT